MPTTGQQVPRLSRQEIETRAAAVLREHGLFSIPVDPVTLANRAGIKVHNAVFHDNSVSGMVAKRGNDITVLVSQAEPPYRKRFTIAHELGHHFLHLLADGDFVDTTIDLFRDTEPEADQEFTDERRKEVQANQFAAALLMPAELMQQQYALTRDLKDLARIFNVSEQAMAIRLGTLGLA